MFKQIVQGLFFSTAALCLFSSCIREEALNAECDITGIDSSFLNKLKADGALVGEPTISNDRVSVLVSKGYDRSALSPDFTLTPGATITPKGSKKLPKDTIMNFSTPQIYRTTSQDGAWHKDYTVSFVYSYPIKKMSFEHVELSSDNKYYNYYEVNKSDVSFDDGSKSYIWGCGNAGYAFCGMAKAPEEYPTVPNDYGQSGKCVKLSTLSTGSFGKGVNMPIAAGNLFIGEFKASQAMLFPLKATRFGSQIVSSEPKYLTGYYKYQAGDVFTDSKLNVLPNRRDTCDIYAVLYEVDPSKVVPLNGADVLSSSRIVSMARIDNPGEPTEWTYFKEPFKLLPGKQIDQNRLNNDGYSLTVVMTSSRQGAYFEGAVGSVLYVDEFRLIWDGDDNQTNGSNVQKRN